MKKVLILTMLTICLVIFTSIGVNAATPCANCGWGTTVYTEFGTHRHGTDPYNCHHGSSTLADFKVYDILVSYYECPSCGYDNYETETILGYKWGCGLGTPNQWCPYCGNF